MGGKTSKNKEVESSTPDQHSDSDLTLSSKVDVQTWKELLTTKLNHRIAAAEIAWNEYQDEEAKMASNPNLSPKKIKKRKYQTNSPPPDPATVTRIDDGVRTILINHSLAPKDANEIKRLIASTTKLERIVVKDHFGGPGIGYRDEIASRVLLAVGKWFGESLSCTSFDISKNDIGGSTRGIDKRTGDLLDPVYDTRKVGPSGSYLLQGLAESKKKRGVANPDALLPEERITKPMERVVVKRNNLTHYGYYGRQVGMRLRELLSNPGRILSLDLSHCSLGPDAAAKGFSQGIRGIERLTLINNQLGGRWHYDGYWEPDVLFARELMRQLLDESCSLKSLDLSSNRFNVKHGSLIAKGLNGNISLKSCVLAHNPDIGDEGIELIVKSQDSDVSILEMLDVRETGLGGMTIFALKKIHAVFGKANARRRNLVIDISVNEVNANQLPESHGDSRVRFVTSSWRHLVGGKLNVATLPQIRNYAVDFVLKGSKFEMKFKKRGRLGLQLIAATSCPDVVEQLASTVVSATIAGSPSQPRKGQRIAVGSLLTHINGVSTSGMTLAQTIERLKSVRADRKQAWADPDAALSIEQKTASSKKKNKKKRKNKKDLENVEEKIEPPDPYADQVVLRFMGKLTRGPPRLKRRRPGSRAAELRKKEEIAKKEQEEKNIEDAARRQHRQDLAALQSSEEPSISNLPEFTLLTTNNSEGDSIEMVDSEDMLQDGWIETSDEWGSTYYWNINTNETTWDRPALQVPRKKILQQEETKTNSTPSYSTEAKELAALLRDTTMENEVSKTEEELALDALLKESELEKRANDIHKKMQSESKEGHAVSITKKTRGKRQSKKEWLGMHK